MPKNKSRVVEGMMGWAVSAKGAPPRMRRAGRLLLALAVVGGAGCTSFAFPGHKGATPPPGEMVSKEHMVEIPAGVVNMGSNRGEPDEYPPHEVQLRAFMMDRYEATNADWQTCVSHNVCKPTAFASDPILGRARHPVVGVTFRDAERYCEWLGKRLPTEAEWEYAARTPRNSVFPWDGGFQPLFVNGRGDADGYEKTAPVGSFPEGRTGLGLHDMAGNVAEWTSDWYEATYYANSPNQNPKGPELSTGSRAVRGGAWTDNDYLLRTTSRSALDPALGQNSVGVRCVKDIEGRR